MDSWVLLIWGITFVFVHELGHTIVAKRRGIYEGWGISLTAHIKVTHGHFPNRYDYLSGVVPSFFTVPILLLAGGGILWLFIGFACCIVLALSDLAILCIFDKIKRTERWHVIDLINEHFVIGLLKVVFLFILFFGGFGIIFLLAGLEPPIDPQLFNMVIAIICIAVAFKVTKWVKKLAEIVKLADESVTAKKDP